ncbi:MAG: hypothetical protein ABIA62_00865 [Candidatus Woesearchaeota archaeon]
MAEEKKKEEAVTKAFEDYETQVLGELKRLLETDEHDIIDRMKEVLREKKGLLKKELFESIYKEMKEE